MSRQNGDDDLTTDAIPSPPRDEVKEEKIEEPEYIYTEAKTKTKKTFKKAKKTSVSASVINISNANGIHIGSNYNVNLYANKSENSKQKDHVVSDAIQALFDSTIPVERKHLIFLAPHINEQWRSVARLLDYSDGQISQFYENYNRSGIKEVIYQLLLDWIQNEADAATVGRLSKSLWNSSQEDAATRWSKHFEK